MHASVVMQLRWESLPIQESLQQQLERRLEATERERDAVKQRLQVETWKPHRRDALLCESMRDHTLNIP